MMRWRSVAILVAGAMLLYAANCPDLVVETRGARVSDVIKDLQWLDQYLPPTAVQISEAYDLDFRQAWGTFVAPRQDLRELRRKIRSAACETVVQGWESAPGKVRWWPKRVGSVGRPLECLADEGSRSWALVAREDDRLLRVYLWGFDRRGP